LGGNVLARCWRFIGLKTNYNDYGVAAIPQPQSPSHRGPPHPLQGVKPPQEDVASNEFCGFLRYMKQSTKSCPVFLYSRVNTNKLKLIWVYTERVV